MHPVKEMSPTALRKCAVKCLKDLGRFEEAITEYYDLIEDAPDTVAALFLDTDRLIVQMMIEGPEIDAVEICEARIADNMDRVEEIYAQRSANSERNTVPNEFDLSAAYPNPFNSTAKISLLLRDAAQVELSIYDMLGRRVSSDFRQLNAGKHTVSWHAENVPSGIYLLKATANGIVRSQKLTLVR